VKRAFGLPSPGSPPRRRPDTGRFKRLTMAMIHGETFSHVARRGDLIESGEAIFGTVTSATNQNRFMWLWGYGYQRKAVYEFTVDDVKFSGCSKWSEGRYLNSNEAPDVGARVWVIYNKENPMVSTLWKPWCNRSGFWF